MCGITGTFEYRGDRPVDERMLVRMRETMHHRGPDGEGLFISEDGHLGLGTLGACRSSTSRVAPSR